ncbi:MAG TPA: autotransporter domain-containing protein [Croceibacterium sp.]|nr:autotransporter domain-containing protein [Croceibacterium sp.]
MNKIQINAATQRSRGRTRRHALLASAAGLSLAVASGASAQSRAPIYLPEGQTVQGDVSTGDPGSRVVLDLSGDRLDQVTGDLNTGATPNSPALLTGDLIINDGADELWLRSQGTASASVFEGTARIPGAGAFDRVVYEASGNDSVLTLTAPTAGGNGEMNQTLHLGGDGTVVVEAVVNTTGTPDLAAIRVERGSTSSALGQGGDGKIDLVIAANVAGSGTGFTSLVDAREADSVLVRTNSTVSTTSGTALDAGDAETVIEASAFVQIRETSLATAAGSEALRTSSSVDNLGTISGINQRANVGNNANGVDATDARIVNRRNGGQVGKIQASGDAILARGQTYVENHGELSSLFGAAVTTQGIDSSTVLRNGQQGLIRVGNAFESTGTSTTAYQGAGGTDVVVNAGVIEGDVLLGGGDDIYLVQGEGTVDGVIDGGAGNHDAYGRSYTTSATAQLANGTLNVDGRTGFEMHGVEAFGADTVVTVTAAEVLTNGIQAIGAGTVINTADIASGAGYGIYLRGIPNVPAGTTFINRGVVTGDNFALRGHNAGGSISNEGTLGGRMGVALEVDEDASSDAFEFDNSGEISASGTSGSAFSAFISRQDHTARITNSGNIRQQAEGSSNDAAYGLNVRSRGRVELDNSGLIAAQSRTDGGARVEAASIDIDNSGTIVGSGAGGSGLTVVATGSSESGEAETVASVTNDGTIRANGGRSTIDGGAALAYGLGVEVVGNNARVEVVNNNTIEAIGAGSAAVYAVGNNPDGPGLSHFRMRNIGTVRGSGTDTVLPVGEIVRRTGMTIPAALNDSDIERTVASAIQTFGTTDHIENDGTIVGNVDLADGDDRFENRGVVAGDVRMGDGDDTYVFGLGSAISGVAYGGDGQDTLLIDGSGSHNGRLDAAQYRGFETIRGLEGVPVGTGVLSVAGAFDVNTVGLANISIQIDQGDTVSSTGQYTFTGSAGSERITNQGTIEGSVDLGAGDDTVINSGTIQGDVLLGDGNDRYVARAGSVIEGVLDGGAGIDTFEFLLSGDTGELPAGLLNFESYAARGEGTLNVTLDQDIETLELLDGAGLVLNQGNGTIRNILGDDSDNHVTINGTLVGGVSLGGGDDVLNLTLEGVLSGALDGGAGSDTLNLTLTGASTINGMNGFETANVFGSSPLTLAGSLGAGQTLNFDGSDNELIIGAGADFAGTIDGGAGRDRLRIQSGAEDSRTVVASQIIGFEDLAAEGPGTLALTGGSYGFQTVAIDGALELGENTSLSSAQGVVFGAADNRFRLGSGATVTGGVDGGAGDDLLELVQGAGTTRSLASVGATGFERLHASGAGELIIDLDSIFDSVSLDGGTITITAGNTLTAPVFGGAGADTLAILGTLVGDVDLGAGDDRLILADLDRSNSYNGGAGTDTIEFRTGATYDAPLEFDGTGTNSFERLAIGAGVVSLTADTSWEGVTITGGRLIGQAGTTLSSSSAILVSSGATFGSAGTVNADIDVRGTLSPGASPGTMTVNGNVTFRTGSNLLLEVSPTVSDLLNISGRMVIETGATMDITGVLQGTPGELLDLVVADGGIEGRFTTINKSDTVFGFIVQNGNRLQIRSEFENDASYPTNVRTSVDYSNQVLRGGYGVQAYTAALNGLTDAQGRVNRTAFTQLTPEAYASAMQAGTDAGLTLSDSTRHVVPGRKGIFLFTQGAFADGDLKGSTRTGASVADTGSDIIYGGVGYAVDDGTKFGAFLGWIDGRQELVPLAARTDSDGMVAGVFADTKVSGFGLHAMLAHIATEATTIRHIAAANATATGRYDLKSWVADVAVDYAFDLGGFNVAPKLGLTYIDTTRDGAAESGAGDFSLTVGKNSRSALYGDAAIRAFAHVPMGDMAMQPYVEAGMRELLDGSATVASGGFTGAAGDGMVVHGVEGNRTTARIATGLALDLSPAVRINAGYSGEFGKTDRTTFTGGISLRF